MIAQSHLHTLKTLFTAYPEIEAVYLFGSAAAKQKTKFEDIDLGIVSSDASLQDNKVELYAKLVKQGFDNVDIVFFNSSDLVLQFEIIHKNQLIYRKIDFNHGELFSNTIRKYFDIKPYLVRQRKKLKERILNG